MFIKYHGVPIRNSSGAPIIFKEFPAPREQSITKTRRIATIFLQNIKMSEQPFLRKAPSAALGVSCSSVNACKNASHLYGKIPVKARNIERGCQQCLRDAIRSVHNVNIKIKSS